MAAEEIIQIDDDLYQTPTYEVETNKEGDEALEGYVYGDQHLVFWTESFGYTITDLHGKIEFQGKLTEEKVGDSEPLTF